MQVYWISFVRLPNPTPLNLGAGVTAHNEADARGLAQDAFGPLPIERIEPVRDVNDLEAGHVRPNMGNILRRGIWFPLGHELPV